MIGKVVLVNDIFQLMVRAIIHPNRDSFAKATHFAQYYFQYDSSGLRVQLHNPTETDRCCLLYF